MNNMPPEMEITRLGNGSLYAVWMSDMPPELSDLPRQFQPGEKVKVAAFRDVVEGEIYNARVRLDQYGDEVASPRWCWVYEIGFDEQAQALPMMAVAEETLLRLNPRTSGELLSSLQANTSQQAAIVAKYAAMESALAQIRRQMGILLGHQDAIYDAEGVHAELEKWYGIAGAALHLGMTPTEFADAAD